MKVKLLRNHGRPFLVFLALVAVVTGHKLDFSVSNNSMYIGGI